MLFPKPLTGTAALFLLSTTLASPADSTTSDCSRCSCSPCLPEINFLHGVRDSSRAPQPKPVMLISFFFIFFFKAVAIVSPVDKHPSTGCERAPELHNPNPPCSSRMSSTASSSCLHSLAPHPPTRPPKIIFLHHFSASSASALLNITSSASRRPHFDRGSPKFLTCASLASTRPPRVNFPQHRYHSRQKLPSLLPPFNPLNEYAAVHISLPPAHIRVRNIPLLPMILTCSFTNRMD